MTLPTRSEGSIGSLLIKCRVHSCCPCLAGVWYGARGAGGEPGAARPAVGGTGPPDLRRAGQGRAGRRTRNGRATKLLGRGPDSRQGRDAAPQPVGPGLGSHPAQEPGSRGAERSGWNESLGLSPGGFRTRGAAGAGPAGGWSRGEAGPGSGPWGRGAQWGGAWRLRRATGCEKQTQPRRLLGARPSTCCPPPARGAAAMRLALLWALGLLGAGSPLPSRPLPGTGERADRSRPGGTGRRRGEVGRHWGAGVRRRPWETPARTPRPAWVCCPGPRARRLGWSGKEGHPPHRPCGHFQAPVPGTEGPGAAPHPLRLVGEGRRSTGLTPRSSGA